MDRNRNDNYSVQELARTWNYDNFTLLFNNKFLGAFSKLRKAAISFVMSVGPHGTTQLPLDGFS